MTEQEYAENVGKVVEDEPMDRIEEIKAYSKKGIDYREDVPFLLGEIDRLKMMLDAAVTGQETLQTRLMSENTTIDRLTAERDAAVDDLKLHGDCDTCGNNNTLDCDIDAETGVCNYKWRGVQK